MATEQTLWFFKAKVTSDKVAAGIERALAGRSKPPAPLRSVPVDDVLASLRAKFKRLKVDHATRSAELDLPERQVCLSLYWTPTAFQAVFEGDGDELMGEVAAVMAEHGCGTVYAGTYFPPSAPYGEEISIFPQIEAEERVYNRVRGEIRKRSPALANVAVEAELDRMIEDGSLRAEVDRVAEEIEANYRREMPPDRLARASFDWFDARGNMVSKKGKAKARRR